MSRSAARNLIFLSIAVTVLCCGCVTVYNPATQRNETLLLDTASEVSLGKDMDAELQHKLKVSPEPALSERLDRIGKRVAPASDRQDLAYYFRVVRDKELNAFALPGGYVYVNSGLMLASTDDELACVVAHEIGHIAARHSVKKLQAVLGYQIVIGIISGATGNTNISDAIDVVFNVVNLGYSRKDEFLADSLAVRYALRSGFDPNGMVTFFEKLQQESKRQGRSQDPVFLSSHPAMDERIKNVKKEIELRQGPKTP